MPNWCWNEFTIKGDTTMVTELLEHAKQNEDNSKFSMEALHPNPYRSNEGWFEWAVDNWGTKWDFSSQVEDITIKSLGNDTTEASFGVDTAWAPPLNFWKTVSKRYPKLSITNYYYEPNVGFVGIAKFKNGKMRNKERSLDVELYKKAGAIVDENGGVDWEIEQNLDFRKALR